MSFIDIFNGNAFGLVKMTEAINKLAPKFSYLGDTPDLFVEESITTLHAVIEEREGFISLVGNSTRGTQGNALPPRKRKVRTLPTFHKQINEELWADSLQNVREFGTVNAARTVAAAVAEKLEDAVDSLGVTLEFMRVGAVKGQVLDADGSIIMDLFEEFGQKQRVQKWDTKAMAEDDGYIHRQCSELIRSTRKALGADPIQSIQILCGNEIFDKIETSKELREAFRRRDNGDFLISNYAYQSFEYGGVRFVNYQGYVGDKYFIDPDEAYLLPMGVKRLFQQIFAPADYDETVNTPGLKFYARQERMKMGKGVDIECQTNPLIICNRPGALCKLTFK